MKCHGESVNQGGGRDKSWANCSKMVSFGSPGGGGGGTFTTVDGDDDDGETVVLLSVQE